MNRLHIAIFLATLLVALTLGVAAAAAPPLPSSFYGTAIGVRRSIDGLMNHARHMRCSAPMNRAFGVAFMRHGVWVCNPRIMIFKKLFQVCVIPPCAPPTLCVGQSVRRAFAMRAPTQSADRACAEESLALNGIVASSVRDASLRSA